MTILSGKRGLIMGVANENSAAWGIAKQAHNLGAKLAFTYQIPAFEKRLIPLAKTVETHAHEAGLTINEKAHTWRSL